MTTTQKPFPNTMNKSANTIEAEPAEQKKQHGANKLQTC